MDAVQTFLIVALAFCPLLILFGPILFRITRSKEFDYNTDAMSTLRDIDSTKRGFIVWIILYMISQLVYSFTTLPFLVQEVPIYLYVCGMGSLVSGVVAFIFVSTSLKHVYLAAISSLFTIFSLILLAVNIIGVDFYLALATLLLAVVMFSFLTTIPLQKMRIWLAEYIALGLLCIWNFGILFKIV